MATIDLKRKVDGDLCAEKAGVVPAEITQRVTDLEAKARAEIAKLIQREGRFLLAFSGGKESALLAELCRPYRDRVSLLWVNTGFMFPHVEAFIREYGKTFDLIELKSDLPGNWRANGLPAEVLPIGNALPGGCHTGERLQAWTACCEANRNRPAFVFINALPVPVTLIHGQRLEDRSPGNGISGWPFPPNVSVVAPLAEWLEDDVFVFHSVHRVRLPDHYLEVADSLDCWSCPAMFLTRAAPQRIDYMARRYPRELAMVLPGVRRIRAAAAEAMSRLDLMIDRAAPLPARETVIVPQRSNAGVGDCVIASLATVAGRSYEEVAALLGFPCDAETGFPRMPPDRGVSLFEIGPVLLPLGLSSTLLISRDHPHAREYSAGPHLSSDGIKAMIQGHAAVVSFDEIGEAHALAWKDGVLHDCRPPVRRLRLEDIRIEAAVIISRIEPAASQEVAHAA